MMVSLSQAEIDDAYHLASFECENAVIETVRRILVWNDENATRDLLINRIAEALHEVEVKHMGAERYAALMERLVSRGTEPRA